MIKILVLHKTSESYWQQMAVKHHALRQCPCNSFSRLRGSIYFFSPLLMWLIILIIFQTLTKSR